MVNKKIGVVLLSVLFAFTLGYFGFRIIELIGSNPSESEELSMDSHAESSADPTEAASPTESQAEPTRVLDRTLLPVPKAVPTIIVSSPIQEQPKLTNEDPIESVSSENSSAKSISTPVVVPPTPVQRFDVLAQKDQPQTKEIKEEIAGNVFMEFVFIPPGEFVMGSPESEIDRFADEGPQHSVKFAEGFWMGKYEVTQGQWKTVMKKNPLEFFGDNFPVENVSISDCMDFIKALNQLYASQKVYYRLPTEAEWEYACRGGSQERYFWGDDSDNSLIVNYAWYSENSNNKIHPVGLLKPNSFGLYDICGNVREWCSDIKESYQKTQDSTSSGTWRVCRGGGWLSNPENCRSAARLGVAQDIRISDLGLRLVKIR